MSDIVIRAKGLSKCYLIGHRVERERYTALRDVLARQASRLARSLRDVVAGRALLAGDAVETFWALKDVDLEIRRGEVVGIIGRNGAGKSTLLKVLSRITEPSEGRVEIRGRVASLLEVGTGFHPELSGRENIFLNGAVLGMTRAEIRQKFDEIIAFAEVEQFLDTPVKRYSSGMYVRLAFAVAAHLEPEILIVDEVLAVGDAQFQKKCLGKMQDVAGQGRTVLFVSHNMAAVSSLTHNAIVLDKGRVVMAGPTREAVKTYARLTAARGDDRSSAMWGRGHHTAVRRVRLLDANSAETSQYAAGEPFQIEVELETDGTRGLSCDVLLVDAAKSKVALGSLSHFEGASLPAQSGRYRLVMSFAPLNLAAGRYTLDVTTSVVHQNWDHYVEDAAVLDVLFSNPAGLPWNFSQSLGYGAIALAPAKSTTIERIDQMAGAAQ